MGMSKKDYQAIARAFHTDRADLMGILSDAPPIEVWTILRERIADVLAADNPRFDRARFLEACETGRCKGMKATAPAQCRKCGEVLNANDRYIVGGNGACGSCVADMDIAHGEARADNGGREVR